MRTRFTGVGTALITPFTKDGSLDEPAIKRLARRQIDGGVHFLSPCGTTGEAPTLSHRDKLRIVELVVEESNGRVPVLAGAGGYDTREVIELAKDMGLPFEERTITRDELYVADEIFLTGTAAEVTPIREVDRRTIGGGRRGPLTKRLQAAYFDVVAGRERKYERWLTYL